MKYDLVILGGGAAGFAAAMKADELKAKTLMVNNDTVGIGGTCVNVGCLPTKHLLYIGELIHKTRMQNFDGLKSSASFDFKTIIEEKDNLIERLRDEKYEKVLSSLSHIEFLKGNAKFISKNEIQMNGEIYTADKFIIATGSSTFIPSIEGIDKIDYLTNIEVLQLKELPKSMIILGGGPLGIEFAQMFSRFGTEVCLLQKAERIVPREEPELADLLQEYLQGEGIEICTNVEIRSVQQENNEKIVKAIVKGEERRYKGEQLLIATGRNPNTSDLGLEKLGVKLGKRGEIVVSAEMQGAENVWSAGDVIGEPMLETVAAKEGMIASNNALACCEDEKRKMDYRVVPHAVFTDPQLAGVGLTDEQAIEKGIRCRCNTIPMELVPKAQAIKDTRGAIKIVIDNRTQEIIGIHILAPKAADLIHEGVMIVKNRMKINDVIDTLHIFPTLSEAIKIAVQSFRRDVTKMSCCVE
ncbi:MAG: mercury(II) reductase [Candidatus Methanofastidiosia archaeon]